MIREQVGELIKNPVCFPFSRGEEQLDFYMFRMLLVMLNNNKLRSFLFFILIHIITDVQGDKYTRTDNNKLGPFSFKPQKKKGTYRNKKNKCKDTSFQRDHLDLGPSPVCLL